MKKVIVVSVLGMLSFGFVNVYGMSECVIVDLDTGGAPAWVALVPPGYPLVVTYQDGQIKKCEVRVTAKEARKQIRSAALVEKNKKRCHLYKFREQDDGLQDGAKKLLSDNSASKRAFFVTVTTGCLAATSFALYYFAFSHISG